MTFETFFKVLLWVIYVIFLPALPLLTVILMLAGREEPVLLSSILSGAEIYLLCFAVLAFTLHDVLSTKTKNSQASAYGLLEALLILCLTYVGALCAMVYIGEHIQSLEFSEGLLAKLGIATASITAAISISVKLFRSRNLD